MAADDWKEGASDQSVKRHYDEFCEAEADFLNALEETVNSHARLLAQNEMLRKALEQINGCYVGKFSGEVIGLKSNTALDEPCRIARAALEQMEKV